MLRIVKNLFAVDLRSLALLRIGLGVAILLDLAHRSLDLQLLYTDDGVLPRALVLAMQGRGALLSIHYWASTTALQAAVFALHAACAAALICGWRTWWATLACWYLASSLQIRQPLVYMGGDSIVRLLLFCSLFLPLGARFSLDAAQNRLVMSGNRLFSGATIALLLQICLIYWATGIAKDGDLWRTGQAVFYALHSNMATPFGEWIRGVSPAVLRALSDSTLLVERFGPLLAFVPIYTPVFRVLTVALFWAFHLGLAAAMNIGLFPIFSMVAWLAFIPTELWERFRPSSAADVPVSSFLARAASIAAIVLITYVVILLGERTRVIPKVLPEPVHSVGWALRLRQTWDMFAPDPPRRASVFIVRETAPGGTMTNHLAADSFRSWLYFGYLQSLPASARDESARYFAEYWCRERNDGAGSPAVEYVTVIAERRNIHNAGFEEPTETVLTSGSCGE